MAVKTIRKPSTSAARHPAEWVPRDIAGMSEAEQEWADLVAGKLAEYQTAASAENALARTERWRLRDALGDLLQAIASRPEALVESRAWPLGVASEKAAGRYLHEVEALSDVPGSDLDLSTPFYSLGEAWGKFCDPPQLFQTRTVRLESLAELDRLPGMSDSAVCGILAGGDPIDEDTQWGPWVADGGILPAANYERLRAARAGEAQVPTTRTTTTRLPGWPERMPVLLLLRQVAATAE